MACLVASICMTFVALALVLSPSVPKVASISRATPLIKEVCVGRLMPIDYNLCVEVLQTEPRVVAATDYLKMSIAIIEASVSRATKTQFYVRKLLNQPGRKSPDYIFALRECDAGYGLYATYWLANALETIQEEDYFSAAWCLKSGETNQLDRCRNAMSSKKVVDGVISKGDQVMHLFEQVAYQTVSNLINN